MPEPLRLSAEGVPGMDPGVVVDLNEGFECDAKTPAIIEQRVMMIGDAPRPWVEIEPGVELAALRGTPQLRAAIAAAQRPAAPAGPTVVLEDLHAVPRFSELERCHHAGESRSQDDDRCSLGVAVESDRAGIGRFGGNAETGHCAVHGGAASRYSHQREKVAPAHIRSIVTLRIPLAWNLMPHFTALP